MINGLHNKGKRLHRKQSNKWKDMIVTRLQDTGFDNPSRFNYGVVVRVCTGSEETFYSINSRAMNFLR